MPQSELMNTPPGHRCTSNGQQVGSHKDFHLCSPEKIRSEDQKPKVLPRKSSSRLLPFLLRNHFHADLAFVVHLGLVSLVQTLLIIVRH